MSHHSSDERLVQFIREHHPSPPSPKENIEDTLIAQIETEAQPTNVTPFPRRRYQGWVFGSAIAASVLLLFTSVRFLQPSSLSPQETAELEAFLIENWEAVTMADPAETSWFIPEQPKSSNRR
ncbi:MAG: hypothetical protein GVY04_07180 [Cyanobacteria bacterium]|jgi:hypothetical protein|nr:hypothetical protein [Cyanobacteria bacterium GSL.Bin1]